MLLFPLPRVLKKFFPADVLFPDALLLEAGHYLAFRGDGGMVCSRYPAGVFPVHAGLADENVVERVVKDVAHVKDASNVGRRNHYGIGLFVTGFAVKELMLQPPLVPLVFYLRGAVFCC